MRVCGGQLGFQFHAYCTSQPSNLTPSARKRHSLTVVGKEVRLCSVPSCALRTFRAVVMCLVCVYRRVCVFLVFILSRYLCTVGAATALSRETCGPFTPSCWPGMVVLLSLLFSPPISVAFPWVPVCSLRKVVTFRTSARASRRQRVTMGGDVPAPRFGHTATYVPSLDSIVVIGTPSVRLCACPGAQRGPVHVCLNGAKSAARPFSHRASCGHAGGFTPEGLVDMTVAVFHVRTQVCVHDARCAFLSVTVC